MCGRFSLTADPDSVAAAFGLAELDGFPPRYNIAPTQPILLVIRDHPRQPGSNLPDRRALLVRWGLIPGWIKHPDGLPSFFNARSETATEKAAFRAAMRHRRSLIPASGFYEWRRDGNESRAYWVRPKGGGIIAFAGLMETYAEPGGSEVDTGAILTTSASADTAHIHDRVPVVIRPQDFSRWLDCVNCEPRHVADLLRPAPAGFFEAVPVSDSVNKVTNTGPELQERVDPSAVTPAQSSRPKPGSAGQLDLF
jgi:putative SOS response-associated peptidase YedK